MADQQRQPGLRELPARAKQDGLEQEERREPREQASKTDATNRPVSRGVPGRRPLFRV